ncbi:U11/U12 small nuclear ribonucleoprotein 25 kDa protein-like [Limulus polyphemus]|uniref:U11/U12 small nuclear ribonucleoprotein 25 kDa protein-like n=1 Tax=Limulus polyphemus TaxID=6850 RepID=A0ABM1T9E7_LIMPO|nr:U11/U12 small nuclear ribonucleoprotein 25 kDa protein-like [Limulus polyphemus]XP_022252503.1 U11/U12 small nuclear ribonucleoprotein 25 kDa protein-like [Limulus polyphemus]
MSIKEELDLVETTVYKDEEDNGCSSTGLSHQEALAKVEVGISELIKNDPLLKFLPEDVTLEELTSQIALEHGGAMTVVVQRKDGEEYPVVVEQKATVGNLKKALQRHVTLKQKRESISRTLSWRYVWKTYWLYFNGQKLTQDTKLLKEYGITNNSMVTFIKRLRVS